MPMTIPKSKSDGKRCNEIKCTVCTRIRKYEEMRKMEDVTFR